MNLTSEYVAHLIEQVETINKIAGEQIPDFGGALGDLKGKIIHLTGYVEVLRDELNKE